MKEVGFNFYFCCLHLDSFSSILTQQIPWGIGNDHILQRFFLHLQKGFGETERVEVGSEELVSRQASPFFQAIVH